MEKTMENNEDFGRTKTIGVRLSMRDRQWLQDECNARSSVRGVIVTPTIFIRDCIAAAHQRRVDGVPVTVPLLLTEIRNILEEIEKELTVRVGASGGAKKPDIPV